MQTYAVTVGSERVYVEALDRWNAYVGACTRLEKLIGSDLARAALWDLRATIKEVAADYSRPLPDLDERRTHLGLTWMTKGPRRRQWVIGWNEAKGDVKGWDYKTGRTGFLGVAGSEEEARAEALRIAALIAAGKTKED